MSFRHSSWRVVLATLSCSLLVSAPARAAEVTPSSPPGADQGAAEASVGPGPMEKNRADEGAADPDVTSAPLVAPPPSSVTLTLMPLDQRVRMTFFLKTNAGNLPADPNDEVAKSTKAERFKRICDAPCAVRIPQGTYEVGLSLDDGRTIAAKNLLAVDKDTSVWGRYNSRLGLRLAGLGVILASVALGAALITQPTGGGWEGDVGMPTTHSYAPYGVALLLLGLPLGVLMVALPSDSASMVRQ
jgi:hypothetical protein